jgi:anaerobic ribonucleoside-triphosphate reductase activating protein
MLRFVSYDIVFQEIPGEVTLALNLSNCPYRCKGCHSPWLRENAGDVLDENSISALIEKYGNSITCICFMGGDITPKDINYYANFIKTKTAVPIKVGWYSGRNSLPLECSLQNFDYIKLGPYIERFGGLDSETTNQQFFRVDNGEMVDMTEVFKRKTVEVF